MDLTAFQIEVTSESDSARQVFFVEAQSGEAAVAILAKHSAVLPNPKLKLQRRLSDAEIDIHQLGPEMIVQWL